MTWITDAEAAPRIEEAKRKHSHVKVMSGDPMPVKVVAPHISKCERQAWWMRRAQASGTIRGWPKDVHVTIDGAD